MTDHTVKNTMPISTLDRTIIRSPGVISMNSSPRNRPIHSPDRMPCPITFGQVRRPVTRSMSFRSVPTISVDCTGNSWSARVSTTDCTSW